MSPLNSEALKAIREIFTPGTKVELVRMNDPQAPAPGTLGTVILVDDLGSIHVSWENGSTLAVVFGSDLCKVVEVK